MIERNQEDVDLVIAFGPELILIEAKGVSAFSDTQLASKLERLEAVREFYDEIKTASSLVNFHFLLMSPREPKTSAVEWPTWASKGGKLPPWLLLRLGENLLEVGQCDSARNRVGNEDYWKIFEG